MKKTKLAGALLIFSLSLPGLGQEVYGASDEISPVSIEETSKDMKSTEALDADGKDSPGISIENLDDLEKINKEIEVSKTYKLATKAELDAYDKALDELKKALEGEDSDLISEAKDSFMKARYGLGYHVTKARPIRDALRKNLLSYKKAASGKTGDGLAGIDKAKDLLKDKEVSLEDLIEYNELLAMAWMGYNEGEEIDLDPKELEEIEAKKGYPDDLIGEIDLATSFDEVLVEGRVFVELAQAMKDDPSYASYDKDKKEAFEKSLDKLKEALKLKDNDTLVYLDQARNARDGLKDSVSKDDPYIKEIEDFLASPSYKKARASYKKDFIGLYERLSQGEDVKTDLASLEEAIKADDFDQKLEDLEIYLEEAKSDKISKDSLQEVKEAMGQRLKEIGEDEESTMDDLLAFEKDLDDKLFPKNNAIIQGTSDIEEEEKEEEKDKHFIQSPQKNEPVEKDRRVVKVQRKPVESPKNQPKEEEKKVIKRTSKQSSKDVKTGIDAILPWVGGIGIIAVIGLIILTIKNKEK
ncbi:MAG: hypothetical protein Q4D88_04700 [Anaerococcus sp.]|nr:hypothetical protein [Anaerococcus sp.]